MRRGDPNPKCPDCKGKGYTYFTDVCGCPPIGSEVSTESVERTVDQYIREENARRGIE